MSFELQKTYVLKKFDDFKKEFWKTISEDLIFTYFTLWNLFKELDPYNIDDSIITDWTEDKQIDSVYINEDKNELNILQVKKSSSTNYWSNTIIQIWNWIEWFFKDEEEVKKLINFKLKNKILEARDSSKLSWDEKMVINVYYCNISDSNNISKEANDEIDNLKTKFKSTFSWFNFKIIWVKEYYDSIKEDENIIINEDLKYLSDSFKIEYDIDWDTKWLVITVPTIEIAKLVDNYWNKLFDRNIRYSLWLNNVNKKIFNTATKEDSKFFWYFNNWITIICDSFSSINNPNYKSIKLNNLQIINWCQTSTTLFNAYKENSLKDDSFVLVKIFSSKDEFFINTITEATNSQTTINSRDLAANDKLQKIIEDNLKELWYFYERKRNQYKWIKISIDKKINNEKLWQAVMSVILKKPSKARSNKNSIFNDDYYDKIFNRDISQLLLSYLIFNYVENKRKNIELSNNIKSQIITYWTFHVARIIWEMIFDYKWFSKDSSKLKEKIKNIEENDIHIDSIYKNSINILSQIIEELKNSWEEIYSYTNFFKKTTTEDLINNKIKSLWQ